MKKNLSDVFDEMKPEELEEFLEQNPPAEVSEQVLLSVKNKIHSKENPKQKKKSHFSFTKRLIAVAACFIFVVVAFLTVQSLTREKIQGVVELDSSFAAPMYYGDESSIDMADNLGMLLPAHHSTISLRAELVETLPDVYRFVDDWNQSEFCLLRMKNVELLKGGEMTDEFYYVIPMDYMTDFSVYDSFVLRDIAQFSYEYSLVYNQTKGKLEQLNLVVCGYTSYPSWYNNMGTYFLAFDSQENFDERLWEANEKWKAATQNAVGYYSSLAQVKEEIQEEIENDRHYRPHYIRTFDILKDEQAKVLNDIKADRNGIFIPHAQINTYTSSINFRKEVSFRATKYINGFASNESVYIWENDYRGTGGHTLTKAHFDEKDVEDLPDLALAYEKVCDLYNNGSITPPHIANFEEATLKADGIFGWYAKTQDGVVGIVRVSWCYKKDYDKEYDDAYFIIRQGSNDCKQIDRDELLTLLGEYESTYIFTGEYNEKGKIFDYWICL